MKILQLCSKPPLPARDGGCIAMHSITQGLLNEGHKVKVLTIFTHKHDFVPEELPAEYLESTGIEGVFVDTRVNFVDAFANFMTADSYNISRFFSPDFDFKLIKILQRDNYDVVHLESLFMTPYIHTIRRFSQAVIVLRSHNLEYAIWARIASGTRNQAKRTYLRYLSKRLREYELGTLAQVNGVAAISDVDRQRFIELGLRKPIKTIPFGIDVSNFKMAEPSGRPHSLFHIGAMDWSPNLEGLTWFMREVWPALRTAHPALQLHLAGRNMPAEWMTARHDGIAVHGEVEDAWQFMNDHSIMIVPLLSGGGIRVKIIEGLAMGKAVISTTIGAEGIDCINGTHLLIADSPGDWMSAVSDLLMNPARIAQLGAAGRQLAERHYDNVMVTRNLVKFYRELRKA